MKLKNCLVGRLKGKYVMEWRVYDIFDTQSDECKLADLIYRIDKDRVECVKNKSSQYQNNPFLDVEILEIYELKKQQILHGEDLGDSQEEGKWVHAAAKFYDTEVEDNEDDINHRNPQSEPPSFYCDDTYMFAAMGWDRMVNRLSDEFDQSEDDVVSCRPEQDVAEEMKRQDKKWGKDRDHDPFLWLTILQEEVGEAAEAALDLRFEDNVETSVAHFREELVQVAAVALQMIHTLDRNEWDFPGTSIMHNYRAPLKEEVATFERMLPHWLKTDSTRDKHVLIKGEDWKIFPTQSEALSEGYKHWLHEPFLVRQIVPEQSLVFISPLSGYGANMTPPYRGT